MAEDRRPRHAQYSTRFEFRFSRSGNSHAPLTFESSKMARRSFSPSFRRAEIHRQTMINAPSNYGHYLWCLQWKMRHFILGSVLSTFHAYSISTEEKLGCVRRRRINKGMCSRCGGSPATGLWDKISMFYLVTCTPASCGVKTTKRPRFIYSKLLKSSNCKFQAFSGCES